jgi:hypothetical protein
MRDEPITIVVVVFEHSLKQAKQSL